jgi:hypothetical protein
MEDRNMTEKENHFTQADRNLIIRLDYQASRMSEDLKSLAMLFQNSDHERRIRDLEKTAEDLALIKRIVYGGIATILLTLLAAGLTLILKR